jgi:hypothetical protein
MPRRASTLPRRNISAPWSSRFFRATLTPDRAVWSFAGIRALYDDGQGSASAVSREYRLTVDGGPKEAPLLSIFGGKLTTYRHLAERVLDKLRPWLPGLRPAGAGRCTCPAAAWAARAGRPAAGTGAALSATAAGTARSPGASPRHAGRARARRGADGGELGEHFGGGLLRRGGRLPGRPRVGADDRGHPLAPDEVRPARRCGGARAPGRSHRGRGNVRRFRMPALIALAAAFLAELLHQGGALNPVEQRLQDAWFQWRGGARRGASGVDRRR